MFDPKRKICVGAFCFAIMMCLSGCSDNRGNSDSSDNAVDPGSLMQSGQNSGSSSTQDGSLSQSVSSESSEIADSSMPQPEQSQPSSSTPVVYFTSDITPEGLVAVYENLGWSPTGKVAVKISTGEPPASNYLRPELIKDLVQSVDGTIVECNTAYGGSRAQNAMHYQVAKDHGFTDIADFKILDEDGSMTLTVNGGTVLSENYVGEAFEPDENTSAVKCIFQLALFMPQNSK